jgi:N-acetylmuramoyl-L-alanine amidase
MGRARQKIMEAPFYILAKAGRPAVLLEVGFISNATEEKRLRDSGYRQKLVESIGSGLMKGTSRWRN